MNTIEGLQALSTYADIAQIVVGVVAAFIAILALRASRKISDQQFRLTNDVHRAHVLPENAVVRSLTVGQPMEAAIAVKNRGQTPALQVRIQPRLYLSPAGRDEMLDVRLEVDESKADTYLAPNDTAIVDHIGKDDAPLTQQQIDGLRNGTLTLHCDYLVEYLDISGVSHRTYAKFFLKQENLSGKVPIPFSYGKGAISIS